MKVEKEAPAAEKATKVADATAKKDTTKVDATAKKDPIKPIATKKDASKAEKEEDTSKAEGKNEEEASEDGKNICGIFETTGVYAYWTFGFGKTFALFGIILP